MRNSIDVVTPETEGYEQVDAAVEKSYKAASGGGSRDFYNQVGISYNMAEVGSYLDLGRPTQALCNVRKVLKGRGLKNATDCVLTRLTRDAAGMTIPKQHQTVILKKLSNTEMRVLP